MKFTLYFFLFCTSRYISSESFMPDLRFINESCADLGLQKTVENCRYLFRD